MLTLDEFILAIVNNFGLSLWITIVSVEHLINKKFNNFGNLF